MQQGAPRLLVLSTDIEAFVDVELESFEISLLMNSTQQILCLFIHTAACSMNTDFKNKSC
jgi:hypothetical protein